MKNSHDTMYVQGIHIVHTAVRLKPTWSNQLCKLVGMLLRNHWDTILDQSPIPISYPDLKTNAIR